MRTKDAPMDDDYQGLLTPLRSFYTLLRQSAEPPVMETDNALWIKTRASFRVTRKLLHGLELLVLLARVDWEVWKQCVAEIWGDVDLEEFDIKPERVGIDLNPNMEGRVDLVLDMLTTSAQDHAQTPEIVNARVLVQRVLHERGEQVTEVPVRVTWESTGSVNGIILKLMQTILTQRFLDTISANDSPQNYRGLRIRVFRPALGTVTSSATELQHLSTIAADGVAIEELGSVKPDAYQQYPVLVTNALWTLFKIGASDIVQQQQGVKTVTVSKSPVGMMPGLYTMIQASPSVERVTIVPPSDSKTLKKSGQEVWKWVAYGLFCQMPTNLKKLRALSISVETLKAGDVEAMRDVVNAVDPTTKLLARASSLAGQVISASRFRLRDPSKNSDEENVVVESPHVFSDLPVLKQSKDWTSVLLPAWGKAWVHREDVVATQRWNPGPFPFKSIARVKLTSLNSESKDGVIALLRLIGSGVRQLALEAKNDRNNNVVHVDWLTEVFDMCPNLDSLAIDSMSLDNFDFLLDAYKSGKCHLRRFKATKIPNTSLDEGLCRLFVALGDSVHPAARYMSDFRCSHVSIDTMCDPIMVATAVAMLEKNKRLRNLEIGFPSNDPSWRRLEECLAPFKIFDKKKTSRAVVPLHARQRVAFLSVVTPQQSRTRSPRAVEQLDACLVSTIFDMVATRGERRVHLGYV